MSSSVRLSVCLSSVTFVHPTQTIEIFGNVSTPFGTLAICDSSVKKLITAGLEPRLKLSLRS